MRARWRDGRVVEGTRLENGKRTFARFLTPPKALSLLSLSHFDFLNNHQKSAQKSHTVSNGSIRFSPVRVPVFVMRLADLKAKPDANHANAHPFHAWSCQLCHQHCAPSPFAQLVSNPTPPGQITREWPSVVFDQMRRGLPLLEFCKHFGLICEVDSAAYPHISPPIETCKVLVHRVPFSRRASYGLE